MKGKSTSRGSSFVIIEVQRFHSIQILLQNHSMMLLVPYVKVEN